MAVACCIISLLSILYFHIFLLYYDIVSFCDILFVAFVTLWSVVVFQLLFFYESSITKLKLTITWCVFVFCMGFLYLYPEIFSKFRMDGYEVVHSEN